MRSKNDFCQIDTPSSFETHRFIEPTTFDTVGGGYHPPALIGGNCKNQMNMVRHNAIFVYRNIFIVFFD